MWINTCGTSRDEGKNHARLILSRSQEILGKTGDIAFKTKVRESEFTLKDYEKPWLILTDLPPEASNVC